MWKKSAPKSVFSFFPNSNNWNMALAFMIYDTDIGEIYATFGTYMAYIWISVRYDLGTVLAKYDVPNKFTKLWTMIPNEGWKWKWLNCIKTYPQLSSAWDWVDLKCENPITHLPTISVDLCSNWNIQPNLLILFDYGSREAWHSSA